MNADSTIAADDLTAISESVFYGAQVGDTTWDTRFDLNFDGRVDVRDLQLGSAFFGRECITN